MAVYWSSPTGSNSISCASIDSATDAAGDDPGSYGTIGRCAECCTAAGDKVNVKAGTYTSANDAINTAARHTTTFVSGTSNSVRTTVQGVPGGTLPVIRVPNWFLTYDSPFGRDYFTIQNLIVDGQDEGDGGGSSITLGGLHARVSNVEIRDSYNVGIGVRRTSLGTQYAEILGGSIHGYGRDGAGMSIYCVGDDVLVDGLEVYDGTSGGMQMYADDWEVLRPTIRNVYIHDLIRATQSGFEDNCFGIFVNGRNALVYNCILDGTGCERPGSVGSGIQAGADSSGYLLAYNNLIINWCTAGIEIGMFTGTTGNIIKNNLILGNVGGTILVYNSSGNTQATNRTTGVLTDYVVSSSDFHLKPGSALIDIGSNLAGIVDTDFDGNARPQGSAWDIGPYEFLQGGEPNPVFYPVGLSPSSRVGRRYV